MDAGVAQPKHGHDQEWPEDQAEEGSWPAANLDQLLAHLRGDADERLERSDE
jgi:hypothetical protein